MTHGNGCFLHEMLNSFIQEYKNIKTVEAIGYSGLGQTQ